MNDVVMDPNMGGARSWREKVSPTYIKEQQRYRSELAAKSDAQRAEWQARIDARTSRSFNVDGASPESNSSNWRFDSSNRYRSDDLARETFVDRLVVDDLREMLAQPKRRYRRWLMPRVVPGAVVTVTFDDTPDTTTTFVLAIESFDPAYEPCSPNSPLGQALLGLKTKQTARFRTASRDREVTILRIVA